MKKYLSLIIYGAVAVIFVLFAFVGCADYPTQRDAALVEAVKQKGYEEVTEELKQKVQLPSKVDDQITGSAVASWLIPVAYILVGTALIFALILPLFYAITQDPKSLIRMLIVLGGIAVLYFICYAMADNTPIVTPDAEMTESGSKAIGGMLIMTYVMIAIAFFGALLGEVSRVFQR